MPEDWGHANVTAIFKKVTRHDAANYRPLSLTSLCCKLLEHVIVSKTVKHLEKDTTSLMIASMVLEQREAVKPRS